MKKALSLALCLAMFVSIFAICTVSAEDTWVTAYDWETNTAGVTDVGGEKPSRATAAAWASGITGSTYGLKLTGGGYPYKTSYISVAMTDELKSAENIRVSMKASNSNDGDNPTLYGIVIDGVNYWHYIGGGSGVNTYKWYPFLTDYYENIDHASKTWQGYTPSVVLTADNLDSVDAILFNYGSSWGDCYIDDIQYVAGETSTPAAPKATFDNGIADVEAVDGVVTLPDATIEGKQLFGWQDAEGNVYKVGAEVEIAEDTAFTAVAAAVELQTGAGIRWAKEETQRGIRFETTVSKDALDALGSSKFELGALILPYANYNADITVESATEYGALNVVDPKVYGEVEDNYRYYTGVVDFEKYFATSQAEMADLKLTAVSYVKVTYADGSFAYFYDMPDATNNVRTVAEVARAALADTEFGYTEDQKAILNLYTQYSAEDTVPEYRKDDMDKM